MQAKNIKTYDGDERSTIEDKGRLITSDDVVVIEDGNTIYSVFATKVDENIYRKIEIAKKDSRKVNFGHCADALWA